MICVLYFIEIYWKYRNIRNFSQQKSFNFPQGAGGGGVLN